MRILIVEPAPGPAKAVAEALKAAGHAVEIAAAPPADTTEFDAVLECRSGAYRRTLEDELRHARKLDLVGRLAGGVAHDFNNLLTVINGYASLLEDLLPAGGAGRAELDEIKTAGDRAASLTRHLLAFSRHQSLEPRILNVNAVIGELGKMMRRLIGEHIAIRTTLAPDLWNVNADPGAIEQIVLNLALNARDAMPDGGTLEIATENDGATGTILILLSDNGKGLSPEQLEQLFEPFSSSRRPGLAGLGLSTAHGLVQQSGGRVDVDNRPGRGTTFRVRLPRAAAAPPPAADAVSAPGSGTVLLVEDEHAVRRLAADLLRRSGYRVLEAEEPDAALALFAQHEASIRIVVTDVVMPGMGGRGLVAALRAKHPDLKILLMSGYADASTRQGLEELGLPLLHKPFTGKALTERVGEMLRSAP